MIGTGYLRCRCAKEAQQKTCPPDTSKVPTCHIDPVVEKPTEPLPSSSEFALRNKATDDIDKQLCCMKSNEKESSGKKKRSKVRRRPFTGMGIWNSRG